MKKVLPFIIFTLIFFSYFLTLFAQSESSALKTIRHDYYNVTEPMIAVSPTDPNNFITVYSKWQNSLSRIPASSYTTDGGVTWHTYEKQSSIYKRRACRLCNER